MLLPDESGGSLRFLWAPALGQSHQLTGIGVGVENHYSVSSGREMRYCAAAERDKISTNDIVQKNGIKFMM